MLSPRVISMDKLCHALRGPAAPEVAHRATVERLNRDGKLFTTGVLDLKEFSAGSAELWVADGDKVIRFRSNLAGKDSSDRNVVIKMEVDISDINATFTIDPPR